MALPQTQTDALSARLGSADLPDSGAWLAPRRQAALDRLRAMGLPGRRDEYWRFTNPALLNAPQPQEAAPRDMGEPPLFGDMDRLRVVFVDGVFDPDASDPLEMEGIEITRLADAGARDIHWAQDLYGALEAAAQTPVKRPFAAMNTAFATDGLLIRVTGKAAKPIHIRYVHRGTMADANLHHVIRVEEGAELTVLENGPAAARFLKGMEVDLAPGAAFHHVRAQGLDHDRQAATHLFARLAGDALFKSFTLTANGIMTRNEAVIDITGDNASAHIAGAALGDGDGFHHDDTVFVTHDAVNCESRQVFKKVLKNGATGVFQGKILVQPGAQKTDGYQISQALLLDDDSQFLAKPELEIYADDVACSHGSTTGALDEDALFYLRARGVPKAIAADMLVLSFLADAIEEIAAEPLRAEIATRLQMWLDRRRG